MGDNLIVDKLSYRFMTRKDMILSFSHINMRKIPIISKGSSDCRGESVRIDEDGFIYINGKLLQESYGKEVMRDPGIGKDEIHLVRVNILCWR